jgi:hypothetical protein
MRIGLIGGASSVDKTVTQAGPSHERVILWRERLGTAHRGRSRPHTTIGVACAGPVAASPTDA